MFMTSLVTRSKVDPELFPLLTIRSCTSEAVDSANGPRFCAQDNFTGCAYEIRCVKLPLSRPSTHLAQQDVSLLKKQQERIDAIMAASSSGRCPPSVALPIDVYIQEQASSGATYVAAVDAFAGLSLADIVRSGWRLIEEHVFMEILSSVEQFGYAAASLPPHGNLTADAVKQLLTVRDGAAEAEQRSRWVVGDWRLLYDESETHFDANTFIGDVEWMLHSAFSQLSVSSTADGSFLSRSHVECTINDAVERIRDRLLKGGVKATEPTQKTTARHLSVPSTEDEFSPTGVSSSGEMGTAIATSQSPSGRPVVDAPSTTLRSAALPSSSLSPPRGGGDMSSRSPSRDVMDLVRDLSLRDKILYHQTELRKEQQLANKYRRRNAPLPPLPMPSPALGNRQDYEKAEAAEYEMQYLTSPIKPRPSRLLSQPPPLESTALGQRSHSAPPATRSSRKRAAAAATAGTAGPAGNRRREGKAIEYAQPHQPHGVDREGTNEPMSRELLLENVISLALITQRAQEEQTRQQREQDRMTRESLRLSLARSAAFEAHRQQRAASANARIGKGGVGDAFALPLGHESPSRPSTGAFPIQQHRQRSMGNRRRVNPQDGPVSAWLQTQASTLNSGVGSATLLQASTSPAQAGMPPAKSEKSPQRAVAGGGGTHASSRNPGAPPVTAVPPVVEPLPLAALLAGRNADAQKKAPQAQTTRDIPPQYSVRASPRTTRSPQTPASAAANADAQRRPSPRGAYNAGGRTAAAVVAPNRSPRQEKPAGHPTGPSTTKQQTLGTPGRQTPRQPPPPPSGGGGAPPGGPLTPSRRASSAGSVTAPPPHVSSAHPHGLSTSTAAPSPRATSAQGTPVSPYAAGGPSMTAPRVQRQSGSAGTPVAPGRSTTHTAIPHGGSSTSRPTPPATPTGASNGAVRIESPHVAKTTPRPSQQTITATAGIEGVPISPRSPRATAPTPRTEATEPRRESGGVAPARRLASPRSTPPPQLKAKKAPTPRPAGKPAEGPGNAGVPAVRPRTVSPVKKREIHPVHEASIGITNRRKRAGISEMW